MERFEMHTGSNLNPSFICGLSDQDLAKEIRECGEWDTDLLRDLVWRAGDETLCEQWEQEDCDFENIAYKAAEMLGVKID